MQETGVQSLGQEDPLEEGMATHSSIFAWEIPWTEEPGQLQSIGSQRVRHDLVTKQQLQRSGSSGFESDFGSQWEELETHTSIFAWEIPWTEEPCRLHCLGLQRVRNDLVTEQHHHQKLLHFFVCV